MLSSARMGRLASALVFCSLASPAMAAPKISAAPPIVLDDATGARTLAVAPVDRGSAVMAYGLAGDIFSVPVAQNGLRGQALSLTTNGRSQFSIERAAAATMRSGDVVVGWIAAPGPRNAAFLRILNPGGTTRSAEVTLAQDANVSHISVTLAALRSGAVAVAWQTTTDAGVNSISLRIVDRNGGLVGKLVSIPSPKGGSVRNPALVPLGEGFVLIYARSGQKPGILAQRYSDRAKPEGDPLRLDLANTLVHERPQATALAAGGYAVVWQENTYGSAGGLPILTDVTLKGRFVDADGEAGKRFAIEDTVMEKSLEQAVSLVDTDAGLLTTWSLRQTVGSVSNVDIRGALTPASAKPGNVMPLARSSKTNETGPYQAPLTDGRVMLGYSAASSTTTDDPTGALASFLTIKP